MKRGNLLNLLSFFFFFFLGESMFFFNDCYSAIDDNGTTDLHTHSHYIGLLCRFLC